MMMPLDAPQTAKRKARRYRPKTNERLAIIGMTGSGKTFFARLLMAPLPRLVVLDVKGELTPEYGWDVIEWSDDAHRKLMQSGGKGKPAAPIRVRIPPPGENDDPGEYWDMWLRVLLGLRNVHIYVDELYGVGPNPRSYPLQALYTRGRSLGIGVTSCMQRPFNIPKYALSEANWIFLFKLNLLDDSKYVAEQIGQAAHIPLKKHAFVFKNIEMNRAVYVPEGIIVKNR